MRLKHFGRLGLGAICLVLISFGKEIGCCSGGEDPVETKQEYADKKAKEEAAMKKCLTNEGMFENCVLEFLHPQQSHTGQSCKEIIASGTKTNEEIEAIETKCGVPDVDVNSPVDDDKVTSVDVASNGGNYSANSEFCAMSFDKGKYSQRILYGDHDGGSYYARYWVVWIYIKSGCRFTAYDESHYNGVSETWYSHEPADWYWTHTYQGKTYGWVGFWWRNDVRSWKCRC